MSAKAWRRVVFFAIIWWTICNQGWFEVAGEGWLPYTQPVVVEVERTYPTNNVVFVQFKATEGAATVGGLVCSADGDTDFIRTMRMVDGRKVILRIDFPPVLAEIKRLPLP